MAAQLALLHFDPLFAVDRKEEEDRVTTSRDTSFSRALDMVHVCFHSRDTRIIFLYTAYPVLSHFGINF